MLWPACAARHLGFAVFPAYAGWGLLPVCRQVVSHANNNGNPMENTSTQALPSLPQHATAAEREQRQFQLSLARTAYNYMRT